MKKRASNTCKLWLGRKYRKSDTLCKPCDDKEERPSRKIFISDDIEKFNF